MSMPTTTAASAEPQELVQTKPVPMHSLPSEMQWYAATTRLGQVHVGIEITDMPANPLQDINTIIGKAALLTEIEMLIQALENWQEVELDLAPSAPPADTTLALRLHSLTHELSAPAFVVFETSAFTQLNDITRQFAEVIGVDSLKVPLKLILDSVSISAEEYNTISEGAMILLPSSFDATWVVRAQFNGIDDRKCMKLAIDRSNQYLVVLGQSTSLDTEQNDLNSDATKVRLSIALNDNIRLPLVSVLSLETTVCEQVLSLNNVAVNITQNGHAKAVGIVCDVGSGCGVVISELVLGEEVG